MFADTIDYGAYVGKLRAFGPPEVVPLADFAGNVSAAEDASLFWERVEAVSFTLAAAAGGANRFPRLRWFAGETVPFAAQVAAFGTAPTVTSVHTFAVDATVAGALSAATIVTPIPGLWLLPAWSLVLDIAAGAAGDAISDVRITRQRYQLVRLHDNQPD